MKKANKILLSMGVITTVLVPTTVAITSTNVANQVERTTQQQNLMEIYSSKVNNAKATTSKAASVNKQTNDTDSNKMSGVGIAFLTIFLIGLVASIGIISFWWIFFKVKNPRKYIRL